MELTLCIRAGEEDRKDVPSLLLLLLFNFYPNKIKSVASITVPLSSVAENESQRNIKSLAFK